MNYKQLLFRALVVKISLALVIVLLYFITPWQNDKLKIFENETALDYNDYEITPDYNNYYLTPDIYSNESNWTSCPLQYEGYCMNESKCFYSIELGRPTCICEIYYSGQRCEKWTWYKQ